ncbi:MAG TPA: lytic transglycosylase domain-containing protein [Pyrinomonadaceae bacterium]|nr:lytic transglycosylase domain-containing protein [Pyrinomonadaceae bacterium]
MGRYLISIIFILAVVFGSAWLYFPNYWEHRFDPLIERHSRVYRVDESLIWSIIYEETYFRPWKVGADQEVGLMQVTPTVAREWAKETGLKVYERQAADDLYGLLSDPEKNIQVGCWYLERLREQYRSRQAETAMMLAAYNAGPSRVTEWTKDLDVETISETDFIARIGISSTKAYVTSILKRYREIPAKTAK